MERKNIAVVKFDVEGIKTDNYYFNGKTYNFNSYEDLQENDIVLVDTANGAKLATVVYIVDKDSIEATKATKDVICKIDVKPFIERKQNEQKKKELKKKIDKRVKELELENFYKKLANDFPEIKDLVDEYQSL